MSDGVPSRRELLALRYCDIYRDGGSYGADFTTKHGEVYQLLLQVDSGASSRARIAHGFLYEGWDAHKNTYDLRRGLPVITGSPEERDILRQLEGFLAEPTMDLEYQYGDPQESFKRLREMFLAIPLRMPCFADDHPKSHD